MPAATEVASDILYHSPHFSELRCADLQELMAIKIGQIASTDGSVVEEQYVMR
jgi:hypothetical protein